MTTFDLVLLDPGGQPVDAHMILEVLERLGLVRLAIGDPGRLVYRNDDTGVFFQALISPEVLRGDGLGPGETAGTAGEDSASWQEEVEDGESDGEDEEEEEEEAVEIETPPVTILVPLCCPAFFARESIAVAEEIARAAGLEIHHSAAAEGGSAATDEAGGPAATDAILSSWLEENRQAALAIKDRSLLTVWPRRKAEDWWSYGTHRQALAAALEPEGIQVPQLQAAQHQGRIKTLCRWELGARSLLPRTDLILIRRLRQKKGLLGLRRVAEEGLAEGARLWDILAPCSELRDRPVESLVFKEERLPQQAAAAFEVLALEPMENARRRELIGVVDFDLAAEAAGNSDA